MHTILKDNEINCSSYLHFPLLFMLLHILIHVAHRIPILSVSELHEYSRSNMFADEGFILVERAKQSKKSRMH